MLGEDILSAYDNCKICPHLCGVNRVKNEKGKCRAPSRPIISGYSPHFGEEKPLVGQRGSGTIFFSYCNLSCVFCQNCDISHYGEGYNITEKELADIILKLQGQGCHNINFVSPSHYWPSIIVAINIAKEKGLKVPIVYNSGGYDSISALKYLKGYVDIYMPDIKFSQNDIAYKFTGAKDYYDICKKALGEMYNQVGDLIINEKGIAVKGLIVRHLVMPEDLSGSEEIFEFLANKISKDTYINIMSQYYPAHKAFNYKSLNRRIKSSEISKAIKDAEKKGLYRIDN